MEEIINSYTKVLLTTLAVNHLSREQIREMDDKEFQQAIDRIDAAVRRQENWAKERLAETIQQEKHSLIQEYSKAVGERVIERDLTYRPSTSDPRTQLIAKSLIESQNDLRSDQRKALAELQKEWSK